MVGGNRGARHEEGERVGTLRVRANLGGKFSNFKNKGWREMQIILAK